MTRTKLTVGIWTAVWLTLAPTLGTIVMAQNNQDVEDFVIPGAESVQDKYAL